MQPPLRRAGTSGATTVPASASPTGAAAPVLAAAAAARTPGIWRASLVALFAASLSRMHSSGFACARIVAGPGARPVMSTHWRSRCAL